MDAEDKNKDVDTNEKVVSIGVDSELIGQVRRGEITHLIVGIDEDNQNFFLENVQGNLVLVTDETPETFHVCYYYNGGEFPYAIKDSLTFLELLEHRHQFVHREGLRGVYGGHGARHVPHELEHP